MAKSGRNTTGGHSEEDGVDGSDGQYNIGPGFAQTNTVDLLEIYHARQLGNEIIMQLRRLRSNSDVMPLDHQFRKREIRGYYEALLLTVAELQHQLGDDRLPGRE